MAYDKAYLNKVGVEKTVIARPEVPKKASVLLEMAPLFETAWHKIPEDGDLSVSYTPKFWNT